MYLSLYANLFVAKQVKLLQLREGKEVAVIAHDVHYSPEEPFKFKKLTDQVKFYPGDEFRVGKAKMEFCMTIYLVWYFIQNII